MDRVKLVAIIFMVVVTLISLQGAAEHMALSIWGQPCRIELVQVMGNVGELRGKLIDSEGNEIAGRGGGRVERHFFVEKDLSATIRQDKDRFERINPGKSYAIDGIYVPWRPQIAAVAGDSRNLNESIVRAILGTFAVVAITLAFLSMHRRRIKRKREAAAEGFGNTEDRSRESGGYNP